MGVYEWVWLWRLTLKRGIAQLEMAVLQVPQNWSRRRWIFLMKAEMKQKEKWPKPKMCKNLKGHLKIQEDCINVMPKARCVPWAKFLDHSLVLLFVTVSVLNRYLISKNKSWIYLYELLPQGGTKQSNLYTEMTSEILQHCHLGRGRCEVFEGRDDVIGEAKDYLQNESTVKGNLLNSLQWRIQDFR